MRHTSYFYVAHHNLRPASRRPGDSHVGESPSDTAAARQVRQEIENGPAYASRDPLVNSARGDCGVLPQLVVSRGDRLLQHALVDFGQRFHQLIHRVTNLLRRVGRGNKEPHACLLLLDSRVQDRLRVDSAFKKLLRDL